MKKRGIGFNQYLFLYFIILIKMGIKVKNIIENNSYVLYNKDKFITLICES